MFLLKGLENSLVVFGQYLTIFHEICDYKKHNVIFDIYQPHQHSLTIQSKHVNIPKGLTYDDSHV
jgi:hypothetical protein